MDVTCISDRTFRSFQGIELQTKNARTLLGPGKAKLSVMGKNQCNKESQSAFSVENVYVVRGLSQPLLGLPAIQTLGIINQNHVNVSSVNAKIAKNPSNEGDAKSESYYRRKYPAFFKGLGQTKWEYSISLNRDAKPFALSTPRKV